MVEDADGGAVAICVCTYKRPAGLRRLLDSLAAQRTTRAVSVVVADNDAGETAGRSVCEALVAEGYRWPLRSFVVAERGLSSVRNAVLAAALEDTRVEYLALLDDDEFADPDWLEAMLRTQGETDADAVDGPVRPCFEQEPTWQASSQAFRNERPSGGPVEHIYGTCNVLLHRRIMTRIEGAPFDLEFGLSGGEDLHFFKRAKAGGARFAHATDALVFETIPASRMTLAWVLRRAFRIGTTEVRVARRLGMEHARWVRFLPKLPVFVAIGLAELVLWCWRPGRRVDALRRLSREAGRVSGMCGKVYQEYATVHGA